MGGVSGNLVPQTLGRNDGDLFKCTLASPSPCTKCYAPHLIANPLVGLEVKGQLGVVPLNDDLGGLLDGLSSDTTHVGDCV